MSGSTQMLQEYYHFVNKAEVGKIIFEDLSDRTTTFLDQMKVFRLINAAGTELNEIDLIVVNPGWRKKENISDTKFSDLQKQEIIDTTLNQITTNWGISANTLAKNHQNN